MKQYTKDGVVRPRNRIVIKTEGYQIINPTEEQLFADGWTEYVAPEVTVTERTPSKYELVQKLVIKQFNDRTDVDNDEALEMSVLVYDWSKYLNKSLKTGQIVSYDSKLYRVMQDINIVLENQYPSINTAALYEVIDKEHAGTLEDPIPYSVPMEIFIEKYYVEDNVVYECIRSSGTSLNHRLSDLVGTYVEGV